MKRAVFYTSFYTNQMHPRIGMEKEILEEMGYSVDVIQDNRRPGLFFNIINILFLRFFKWDRIFHFRKTLSSFDVVFVYDLSLLPLVLFASKNRQKVIYETLDFNVDLVCYSVLKKAPFLRVFDKIIRQIFSSIEKALVAKYVSHVIVNGFELQKYFADEKCRVNLYASPFELLSMPFVPGRETALLYLGLFTSDKGAVDAMELSAQYNRPLFVFGTIPEETVKEAVKALPLAVFHERVSKEELGEHLSALNLRYRLVGLSTIKPVHFSYAVQEANKEIDYLAMGVPFIGNDRVPTLEKTEAGCGVFYRNQADVADLLNNDSRYERARDIALRYYRERYHSSIFKRNLLAILNERS